MRHQFHHNFICFPELLLFISVLNPPEIFGQAKNPGFEVNFL